MEDIKKFELVVEHKSFTNEQGENIGYYSYTLEIGGERFSLKPKAEDKKMLEYFLKILK